MTKEIVRTRIQCHYTVAIGDCVAETMDKADKYGRHYTVMKYGVRVDIDPFDDWGVVMNKWSAVYNKQQQPFVESMTKLIQALTEQKVTPKVVGRVVTQEEDDLAKEIMYEDEDISRPEAVQLALQIIRSRKAGS